MAEINDVAPVTRKPRSIRFVISLRMYLLLVAVVGGIIGIQYRRAIITPRNVTNLKPVARLDKNDIWQIAWSRDRRRIGVIGWEKPVEVRDAVTLGLRETIGAGKQIIHFAFSPSQDLVAYSENDATQTAVILDRRTGKSIELDTANDQPDVVFSPDGSTLATGGYGTFVRLWSVTSGELLRTFDAGKAAGGLTSEFSPDGRSLAVGNRNSATRLFDVATGKLLSILSKSSSHELQFHPRGDILAVTYVDGSLALWRVPDGTLLCERPTSAEELYSVDWSPDGQVLATSGLRGKITLWDPSNLWPLREIPSPEWVVRVRFSPDGLNLNYVGGNQVAGSKRHLGILGIEGSLYSLLNRPR